MKKKHVLLVGNTSWSMYNFRGELIKYLISKGYDISVAAPSDNVFPSKIKDIGANYFDLNLDAKSYNPLSDLCFCFNLRKLLKKVNPDFVFFYTIKPNIYGCFVAKSMSIPHIAITTGLGYTFLQNNFVSKVAKMLYKRTLKSAKEVWFLNDDDLNVFIGENLINKTQGFVLKSEGVNIDKFFNDEEISNESLSFLLVSRMLWDKGVGFFVDASRILKKKYPFVNFNLLGFMGVNNPNAISKEQMNEWENEGIISYLGSTDNVIPIVKQSTCVVLPSYYREGIPLTLLEAAALGKPVITTDNVGCRETLDDKITGFLCKSKDVQSLVEAMEKIILMSNEDILKMGLKGREKIKKEFDQYLIFDQYVKTIEKYL